MQFFRSCFRERGSPNGEDFYPQTRRFPAAILGGSQGEATQYTDKKTAQAVCNAYENGFSGRNEMKEKGWRPFWAALLAALLVLLPLVGGTVLLTRRTLRTRLASRPQSGVAIRQPKEENRLSLLVCIAPTETTAPGFLLLYLNASQNCIHALALPGELTVPFVAAETALSDCYRAAGPARQRVLQNLVRSISDKYFLLSRRVDLLLLKSLRAKVCAYLLSEAEVHHSLTFTVPYSRIQLADYLNCDRSALSRELSLMQRDGLLETYKSSFKLLEPDALRHMVL